MTNQPKIGQEVLIHGYIDEIRKDTIIIQNDGGYFGTVEHEISDIEMPNTNEVLDKIRAEIGARVFDMPKSDRHYWEGVDDVMDIVNSIIDKYREVSE